MFYFKIYNFFLNIFFHGQRRAPQLVINKCIYLYLGINETNLNRNLNNEVKWNVKIIAWIDNFAILTTWRLSLIFEIIYRTYSKPNWSKIIDLLITEFSYFQNVVHLSCDFGVSGLMENFFQISIILVWFIKTEIWTKCQHKKGRPHAGNEKTRRIMWLLF